MTRSCSLAATVRFASNRGARRLVPKANSRIQIASFSAFGIPAPDRSEPPARNSAERVVALGAGAASFIGVPEQGTVHGPPAGLARAPRDPRRAPVPADGASGRSDDR